MKAVNPIVESICKLIHMAYLLISCKELLYLGLSVGVSADLFLLSNSVSHCNVLFRIVPQKDHATGFTSVLVRGLGNKRS